jgi:hypothetical protein
MGFVNKFLVRDLNPLPWLSHKIIILLVLGKETPKEIKSIQSRLQDFDILTRTIIDCASIFYS